MNVAWLNPLRIDAIVLVAPANPEVSCEQMAQLLCTKSKPFEARFRGRVILDRLHLVYDARYHLLLKTVIDGHISPWQTGT